MKKYIVDQRFKDAEEYVKKGKKPKYYEIDEDVSKLDADRLESLVGRGLVRVEDDGREETPEPVKPAATTDPKDKK